MRLTFETFLIFKTNLVLVKPDVREEYHGSVLIILQGLLEGFVGLGCQSRVSAEHIQGTKIGTTRFCSLSGRKANGFGVENLVLVPALGKDNAVFAVQTNVEAVL